jgi:hypothetical protein
MMFAFPESGSTAERGSPQRIAGLPAPGATLKSEDDEKAGEQF